MSKAISMLSEMAQKLLEESSYTMVNKGTTSQPLPDKDGDIIVLDDLDQCSR